MKLFSTVGLIIISQIALSELTVTKGHYELHYNTIPSTFLSKEIATTHQIKRSNNRGVLSITLMDISSEPVKAVEAAINVSAQNILGQKKDIEIKTVKEGNDATYYLALYMINDQESIHFTIEAQPKNSQQIIKHEFSREFFTD